MKKYKIFKICFSLLHVTLNITKGFISISLITVGILLTHFLCEYLKINHLGLSLMLMVLSLIPTVSISMLIEVIIDIIFFKIFKRYSNIYCTPNECLETFYKYFKNKSDDKSNL